MHFIYGKIAIKPMIIAWSIMWYSFKRWNVFWETFTMFKLQLNLHTIPNSLQITGSFNLLQGRRFRWCPSSGTHEAGSDPRGHLWVTWGVYLCAGKPPLADIILSHPPHLTRCDSVLGLAIPAMSGHIQYRGTASGDLYIGISGINRVFLS